MCKNYLYDVTQSGMSVEGVCKAMEEVLHCINTNQNNERTNNPNTLNLDSLDTSELNKCSNM
jgi:hypothetical protein